MEACSRSVLARVGLYWVEDEEGLVDLRWRRLDFVRRSRDVGAILPLRKVLVDVIQRLAESQWTVHGELLEHWMCDGEKNVSICLKRLFLISAVSAAGNLGIDLRFG